MKTRKSKLFLIVAMLVMSIFAAITCIAGCNNDSEDLSVYVIRGAKDISITTEVTEYDFLDGVTGTKDGESHEVTCDSSAVVFGTAGSYNVVYTCGTETKTVKCNISAPQAVYALELTKTAESFTVFETAESTGFDTKSYISVATKDGTAVKDEVTVTGSVTWGTVGNYELTYALGGVQKKLTVSITMPECVLTLSETQVSFDYGYDGADFDETSYISVATADGKDAKAHVNVLGVESIKFGTPGSYQVIYSLGDKNATLTVTVNAPVYTLVASDFNIKNTVVSDDVTDALIIEYANASGTLDGAAHAVTVDWSAIVFGTNGDYDVVFRCGTESKTVKCHVVDRVYELELTKTAETFAYSATAESTEFDKAAYVHKATCEGEDAKADVEINGEVTWGTPGNYDITYTLGNLERTLTVTIAEPVYELELTKTSDSFKSIADGEGFNAEDYIQTATIDGTDAKTDVEVTGTVTWGTPGQYTLAFKLGSLAPVTVTITIENPVFAISGTKDLTVKYSDENEINFLDGVSGTQDGEKAYTVEVNTEAIDWAVADEYDVVYTCGYGNFTETVTVKCKVYTLPTVQLKTGVTSAEILITDAESFDAGEYVQAKDCFDVAITEFSYNKTLLIIESGDTNTVNLVITVTDAAGNTATITLPVTLYTAAAWYGREITGEKMSFFIETMDTTGANSVAWDETEGAYHLVNNVTAEDNTRMFVLDLEYIKGVQQTFGAISVSMLVKPDKANCAFYAEFIKDGNWTWQTDESHLYFSNSQNTEVYHQVVFNFSEFIAEEKTPLLMTIGGGMYVKNIEFLVPKASGETAASLFITRHPQANTVTYDIENAKYVMTNNSTLGGNERYFYINKHYIATMKAAGYTHISFDFKINTDNKEFYMQKYVDTSEPATEYTNGWDGKTNFVIDISAYAEGETLGFLKAPEGSFEISNLQFIKSLVITADKMQAQLTNGSGTWKLAEDNSVLTYTLDDTTDHATWWQDQSNITCSADEIAGENIAGIKFRINNECTDAEGNPIILNEVVFGVSGVFTGNQQSGWIDLITFDSTKLVNFVDENGNLKSFTCGFDVASGCKKNVSIESITIFYN